MQGEWWLEARKKIHVLLSNVIKTESSITVVVGVCVYSTLHYGREDGFGCTCYLNVLRMVWLNYTCDWPLRTREHKLHIWLGQQFSQNPNSASLWFFTHLCGSGICDYRKKKNVLHIIKHFDPWWTVMREFLGM